ncbi:MAG: GNAT family N-acetyltransferase [Candidatus Microsaccharimonas sp.]
MTGIVSFENIQDMHSVAENFSSSLSHPDNADIAKDFPGTVRRYAGDVEDVYAELMKTREQCQDGTREQFIVYAGEIAVGLSAIQLVDEPPEGIDVGIPNLSGMIFSPWRGKGFGSLSLKYRLDIVDERFGGRAYSLVRKDNTISQKLVESNGLFVVGEDDMRLTYSYDRMGK